MSTFAFFRVLALAVATAAAAAQSLTGTIVDTVGNPVPGTVILLSNNGGSAVCDALGVFSFPLLQNRTYTVSIEPPTSQQAPRQLSFRVQGASTMGNVVVQPGARVFGTVLGPGNLPVANANLDATDANLNTLYTPNDSTDLFGAISVTVPLGQQTRIRINPPAGANLIRFETTLVITGDLDLGTILMPQAYSLTGTVADSVTNLPIGGVTVSTFDNVTGLELLSATAATNSLGGFTIQVPVGIYRLEFDPPVGNPHAARERHGVPVFGNTNLGIVGLKSGIAISGTVSGPAGPIANADVDILDIDKNKLFTLHDNTTATGTFSLVVPPGSYHVRVDPLPALGLVGAITPLQTFSVSTAVAPITLQPGVLVQLGVVGPLGLETNADLDFFDPVTHEPIILVGDKSDASGIMNAIVPTGLFDIGLDAAQGSLAAPLRVQANLAGPVATPVFLPMKTAMCDLRPTFGMQTIAQNGTLFVDAHLRNLQTADLATTVEVALWFPSGQELQFLALPLSLPAGIDFTLGEIALPMPAVPATEVGRALRIYLRLRGANQLLLDQAYVEFFVE